MKHILHLKFDSAFSVIEIDIRGQYDVLVFFYLYCYIEGIRFPFSKRYVGNTHFSIEEKVVFWL